MSEAELQGSAAIGVIAPGEREFAYSAKQCTKGELRAWCVGWLNAARMGEVISEEVGMPAYVKYLLQKLDE